MSKQRIGTINGHEVFVDTGGDQVKVLLDRVNEEVDKKRVKAGDKWIIPMHFSGEKPLIAEVHIKPMPTNETKEEL